MIINPDTYIEGFFSGEICVPYTCTSLGYYDCGSWPDGCGGMINCGTCPTDYICTNGICAFTGTGGDTGGGGGTTTPTLEINVNVFPTSFKIPLIVNTNKEETIVVTNPGNSKIIVPVGVTNLSNMILFDMTPFELAPGASKDLKVTFVGLSETGNFAGNIIIGDESIPVEIIVRTRLLLFDSNIVVLNKDYKVIQGDKLKTQVSLIPMGDKERMDVTLNYVIKDYHNKIYLTKSETLLIDKKMDFKRNFDTGILPPGKYIVGLELVYPNGVAPSSAHFEVVEKERVSLFGKLVFYLILLILLTGILIVILLIIRRKKQIKSRNLDNKDYQEDKSMNSI